MASTWSQSWGGAWGNAWGVIAAIASGSKAVGGGGSIFYQVPRRKLALKDRPNDHLEAVISAAELEHMYRTLTDPERASPKMIGEATQLLAPHTQGDQIDFVTASTDGHLPRSLQAIYRRYDEKRKEQRRGMRDQGLDPAEFH